MGRTNMSRPGSSNSSGPSPQQSRNFNYDSSSNQETAGLSPDVLSGLDSSPPVNPELIAMQEKLKELYKLVRGCHEERTNSDHNLSNIIKTHDRMKKEQKLSPYFKTKLRGLYNTALQDAGSEAAALRKALGKIAEIKAIKNERRLLAKNAVDRPKETVRRGALMKGLQQSGQTLPLWLPNKIGESPPPLCGALPPDPNHIGKFGDMVAALVKGADGDENWILAEISSYNHSTNKYEVDDIDEEQKEVHILSKRRVVPLPLYRANALTEPEALFPKGTLVYALYPQTTCFYRAVVHEAPVGPTDDYKVLFEDPAYTDGYAPPLGVAQRYVIVCKDKSKK